MKSFTETTEVYAKRICPQCETRYCYDECTWFGNCPSQMAAEQLPEGKVWCSNCGRVLDRWAMFEIVTGRVQYLCPKCYLKGQGDAGFNEYRRAVALKKKRSER